MVTDFDYAIGTYKRIAFPTTDADGAPLTFPTKVYPDGTRMPPGTARWTLGHTQVSEPILEKTPTLTGSELVIELQPEDLAHTPAGFYYHKMWVTLNEQTDIVRSGWIELKGA